MFQEHISLKPFSHYRIGGTARYFFDAHSVPELRGALRDAQAKKLKLFILGHGTNILFPDHEFPGLVVQVAMEGIEQSQDCVTTGAGASMKELLDFTVHQSLSGLEWAGGLPGSVGGAVRGNAGAFGGEIKDTIQSVVTLNTKTLRMRNWNHVACKFGYRSSVFKEKGGEEIILSATFSLRKGSANAIRDAINEKINYRAERQPLDYPNVGSIFKNIPMERVPKVHHASLASVIKTDPFPVVPTAYLLAQSGLKGVTYGGAMISSKHPNFIVNALGASASDVKQLILLAKATIKEKFGIELEEEIEIV